MAVSDEFWEATLQNPVVYTEFDSDLKGQSLSVAQRLFDERWENKSVFRPWNIFSATKSVFPSVAEIFTPSVMGEVQKIIARKDESVEETAERWNRLHFPDSVYHTLLINNAHPEGLISQFAGDERLTDTAMLGRIQEKIQEYTGIEVSTDTVKQAVLTAYVKDALALHDIEGNYGIGGKFVSSVGNFALSAFTDPLSFAGDILAMGVAGAVGAGVVGALGVTSGLALGAAALVGESVGFAAKDVALVHLLTNDRRERVGLPPLSKSDIFENDVLGGIALGAAFGTVFKGGGALLGTVTTAFPNLPAVSRVFEAIQNSKMRYKHSPKTDAELENTVNVAKSAAEPFDGIPNNNVEYSGVTIGDEGDKVVLSTEFPRLFEQTIPSANRAFNNAFATVMSGTTFLKDTEPFFKERLSKWIAKLSNPELSTLAECVTQAKNGKEFYDAFLGTVKSSGSKNEFTKNLRSLLFDNESIKLYQQTKRTVTMPDGETERNTAGHSALDSIFTLIVGDAHNEGITRVETRPDTVPLMPADPNGSEVEKILSSEISDGEKAERILELKQRENFDEPDERIAEAERDGGLEREFTEEEGAVEATEETEGDNFGTEEGIGGTEEGTEENIDGGEIVSRETRGDTGAGVGVETEGIIEKTLQNSMEGRTEGTSEFARLKERFLTEKPKFSHDNPYAARNDEAGIAFAVQFEMARSNAERYLGEIKNFTVKDLLLANIAELNQYSGMKSALHAEFGNNFYTFLKQISDEDLVNIFRASETGEASLSSEGSKLKKILGDLQNRYRTVLRDQYGIEFGTIENYIPQKWLPGPVLQDGKDNWIANIFPSLDIEKTTKARNTELNNQLYLERQRLESLRRQYDIETNRRTRPIKRLIGAVQRTASRGQTLLSGGYGRVLNITQKNNEWMSSVVLRTDNRLSKQMFLLDEQTKRNRENTKLTAELNSLKNEMKTLQGKVSGLKKEVKTAEKNILSTDKFLESQQRNLELVNANQYANSLIDFLQRNSSITAQYRIKQADIILNSSEKKAQRILYNFVKRRFNKEIGDASLPQRVKPTADLTRKEAQALMDALPSVRAAIDRDTNIRIDQGLPSESNSSRAYGELQERNAADKVIARQRRALFVAEKMESLDKGMNALEEKYNQKLLNSLFKSLKGRPAQAVRKAYAKKATVESNYLAMNDALEKASDNLNVAEEVVRQIKSDGNELLKEYSKEFSEQSKEVLADFNETGNLPSHLSKLTRKAEETREKITGEYIKSSDMLNKTSERIIAANLARIEKIENRSNAKITNSENRISGMESIVNTPFSEQDLGIIYDNMIKTNLLDPDVNSMLSLSNTESRILYFKDIDMFKRANERYGAYPDFRMLTANFFETLVRRLSRQSAFNGSPDFFANKLQSDLQMLSFGKPLGFNEGTLLKLVNANIDYVSGKTYRKGTVASAVGQVYLSLIKMSALGGAGLTTLFDDAASIAFSGSRNGFGYFRTIGSYLKGITKAKVTPEEASRLLVTLDEVMSDFNNPEQAVYHYQPEQRAAVIGQTAQNLDKFTFKFSGVNWLTTRGKLVFNRLFLQELGSLRSETNPRFRKLLGDYGFTAEDIEAIGKLPLDDAGVPDFSDTFRETKLYQSIVTTLHEENRKAIASTSQSLRAMMLAEGNGGMILGLMSSLFFLKRIPVQVSFDRMILPVMRGQYGDAAKFFAQNLIFTAARLTLKYLTMGYAPNVSDPNFYREVFIQNAAMIPFVQPFFSNDKLDKYSIENAVGRSFLGAYSSVIDVATLFKDAVSQPSNKEHKLAMDVHRLIRDFAPIKTHPALALMYERFIFDNFLLAWDPEAYRTLAKYQDNKEKAGQTKLF